MKISITTNNKVYSVEDELGFDCVGIDEAVEMFRGLLVCAGFHPSNVDNQFNLDSAWFTEDENTESYTNGSNKIVNDWYKECEEETDELVKKRVEEFQANLYNQSLKD